MKDKKKDKPVIDMCVIPPLEETIEGFANPDGDFAKYADLYGKGNTESFLSSIKSDPVGFLLSLMDDAGVDIAVLPAEDAETTMGMKTPNEKVAAFVGTAPDRFIGMAAVDPHKGMTALRDLEHAVEKLNMRSLCLEPWLHKLRSNDKLYYPIYAKCIELDIPVWIHSSINYVPQLTMDFGRPIYLDEVAGHFPELKIIAGHGGWPWVDEMMALLWRHSNVYTDISAIRPKYLDTPGTGWASIIRYGNSLLQDKILFGTAWPAQQFKESIEEIKVLPLKEEVKDKWLGGNAKQLLGL
ncbi:MAG: amidohydrolase [Deltaproteobacteria bacterium]|nr:amidohydrolase [Deltaproteobacteria bacterium]MBW1985207.1 amidohydrolase [Deltaproteobacteria bacterium]